MRHYTQTPPDEFWAMYKRCDACGFVCKYGRTPRGGRHVSLARNTGTDAVTGKTIYLADVTPGCPFCGSPAWADGGRLGDLARVG